MILRLRAISEAAHRSSIRVAIDHHPDRRGLILEEGRVKGPLASSLRMRFCSNSALRAGGLKMKGWLRLAPLVLIFAVGSNARAATDGKPKIAVLDVKARGVDASMAAVAATLLASELNKLEVFKAISKQDIRDMFSFEKDKQSIGCGANGCLAEIIDVRHQGHHAGQGPDKLVVGPSSAGGREGWLRRRGRACCGDVFLGGRGRPAPVRRAQGQHRPAGEKRLAVDFFQLRSRSARGQRAGRTRGLVLAS